MARKNVSAHTNEQFALFVRQLGDGLDEEKKAEFEDVVRRLVRAVGPELADAADSEEAASEDPVQALREAMSRATGARATRTRAALSREPAVLRNLPARPDFDAIERAAAGTVSSRANLMSLIGQLVFSCSHNESLLIYIMMMLLQTDEPSATVVFSTLNTTRARLDLVSRLARIKIADRPTRLALDQVVQRFNEVNQVRNEFLESMHTIDAKGAATHTQNMRPAGKGGRLNSGQQQAIDKQRIDGLVKTCGDLRALNRTIWDLLPQLARAVIPDGVAAVAEVRSGAEDAEL